MIEAQRTICLLRFIFIGHWVFFAPKIRKNK